MLFICNSVTHENAQISSGDEPIPSEGPTRYNDSVDQENRTEFMESFDTTIESDRADMVDEFKQARKRKLKKFVEKTPPQSQNMSTEKYCNACNHSQRLILDRCKEVIHTHYEAA